MKGYRFFFLMLLISISFPFWMYLWAQIPFSPLVKEAIISIIFSTAIGIFLKKRKETEEYLKTHPIGNKYESEPLSKAQLIIGIIAIFLLLLMMGLALVPVFQ